MKSEKGRRGGQEGQEMGRSSEAINSSLKHT